MGSKFFHSKADPFSEGSKKITEMLPLKVLLYPFPLIFMYSIFDNKEKQDNLIQIKYFVTFCICIFDNKERQQIYTIFCICIFDNKKKNKYKDNILYFVFVYLI